jgi:hypothetical protein
MTRQQRSISSSEAAHAHAVRKIGRAFGALAMGMTLAAVALAASAATTRIKYIHPKLESEIVGAVPFSALGHSHPAGLTWCFASKPAFLFTRVKSVMRMTFDGALEEIINAGVLLYDSSVECSDNGDVVTALSQDGAKLFAKKGGGLGIYRTSGFPKSDVGDKGFFLSPNGRTIVVPFDLAFEAGDDVLRAMRVVKVAGRHFSWRSNEQVTFVDPGQNAVRTYDVNTDKYSMLLDLRKRYKDGNIRVHAISHCARHALLSVATGYVPIGQDVPPDRQGMDILNLDPFFVVLAARGESSSLSLYPSNRRDMCLITQGTGGGPVEFHRDLLLFDDGLVRYTPPRGVDLEYEVQVSPRGCLVSGYQFRRRKDGGATNDQFVIALRITRSGACAT